MNRDVVKELNAFLKGQYMGIHAYETYISKIGDPSLKGKLQEIQKEHKMHAMKVAERIQNLGGKAADDEGVIGSIEQSISRMMTPEDTRGIIENAIFGENHYGIGMTEELVRGDLDEESMRIVREILDDDRRHVDDLKKYLH